VSVLLRRPHLCLNRCRGRRRPGMDAAQIGHRDSRFTLNVYTDVHNRRQSAAERVGGLIRASEWAPLGHGRFCRCSARSERAGFGPRIALRGISSVGRAPALQAGGRRFESGMLHRVAPGRPPGSLGSTRSALHAALAPRVLDEHPRSSFPDQPLDLLARRSSDSRRYSQCPGIGPLRFTREVTKIGNCVGMAWAVLAAERWQWWHRASPPSLWNVFVATLLVARERKITMHPHQSPHGRP
jgi:hypothetical protein